MVFVPTLTDCYRIVIVCSCKQTNYYDSVVLFSADLVHCTGLWTAGQRVDPTRLTPFVWKLITANGYRELPLNYTNWYPGEPNNAGGSSTDVRESCLYVLQSPSKQYQWNDARCYLKWCYVCEYEM